MHNQGIDFVGSSARFLPSLQTAAFLLPIHLGGGRGRLGRREVGSKKKVEEGRGRGREGRRRYSQISFFLPKNLHSRTHVNLIISQRSLPSLVASDSS